MTQTERRQYLISTLLEEHPQYSETEMPLSEHEQKLLLRALFNIRMPAPVKDEFLEIQNEYLQEEIRRRGITDFADLSPIRDGICLWKGDITTLRCDAIVNAANSGMLGCFCPNHGCIDNAIHTYSGVQLRLACNELIKQHGANEATGKAKITPAFNLPSKYILHTVGPIVQGALTQKDCKLLASCYRSCLELAEQNGIKSIAFCCISTGEFHFPNDKAAQTAIEAVKKYKKENQSEIKVIFNVFKERDYNIYRKLLQTN